MSQLIQKSKTVYTLSSYEPLFLFSEYDKCMFEVKKQEQSQSKPQSRIEKALNTVFGKERFFVTRYNDEKEIEEITSNPQSVIINMPLAENCLIGAKNDSQEIDGGLLFSTYPDLSTGNFYGAHQEDIPNFAINFFANRFGETDVDSLREELTSQEETESEMQEDGFVQDATSEEIKLDEENLGEGEFILPESQEKFKPQPPVQDDMQEFEQ